jgi:hypothetical protein
MKRREFITLLGGAASTWPGVARAQQAERMRHVGVLMNLPADAPEAQAQMAAFVQGAARRRLGSRPQFANRVPVGRRRPRAPAQKCSRLGCTQPGRHIGRQRSDYSDND